jgi:hypothetical protein
MANYPSILLFPTDTGTSLFVQEETSEEHAVASEREVPIQSKGSRLSYEQQQEQKSTRSDWVREERSLEARDQVSTSKEKCPRAKTMNGVIAVPGTANS